MGRRRSLKTSILTSPSSSDDVIVLQDSEALKNVDVTPALEAFRSCPTWPLEDGGLEARFRRSESLDSIAKSVLKHRIKLLTGRNSSELESQLGFSILEGRTISVGETRKLAHFLILQANKVLHNQANGGSDEITNTSLSARKRRRADMDDTNDCDESKIATAKLASTSPSSSRSSTPRVSTPNIRQRSSLRRFSNMEVEPIEEEREEDVEDECQVVQKSSKRSRSNLESLMEEEGAEDRTELENPTPQMKAVQAKTRQLRSALNCKPSTSVRANREEGEPLAKRGARIRSDVAGSQPPKALNKGFPGVLIENVEVEQSQNHVYLTRVSESSASVPSVIDIRSVMGEFCQGFYLTVIEPPDSWDASQVFSVIQGVRGLNRSLKMDNFLVLVKCNVNNIKLIQEALLTQTRHVQFGVWESKEIHKETDYKLMQTSSLYVMGYFFPSCNEDHLLPSSWMVREGSSTVFSADTNEALENLIVGTLMLPGHCLLEVHCRDSELSLAAQKTGRSAFVVNGNRNQLQSLKSKAEAIAKFHHKTFVGGVIHSL